MSCLISFILEKEVWKSLWEICAVNEEYNGKGLLLERWISLHCILLFENLKSTDAHISDDLAQIV